MTERLVVRITIPRDTVHGRAVIHVAIAVRNADDHAPSRVARRRDGTAREVIVDFRDSAGFIRAVRDAFNGRL